MKDAFHVNPINDLKEHDLSIPNIIPDKETGKYCQCKCLPREEWENDCLIIIHNAYDGRQQLEQANDILNP